MNSTSSKVVLSCAMALIAGYAVTPMAAQTTTGPTRTKADAAVHRKSFPASTGRGLIRSGTRIKVSNSGDGGLAGAPIVNEGFEAFVNGPVTGQSGWTTFAASLNSPVVSSTTPLAGLKSVELPDDPAVADGGLNGVFSPTSVQAPGDYTGTAKIKIPNTGGADYTVAFQAPSQSLITARVEFFFDDADGDTIPGDILVYDGATGDPQVTGFEYTPGATHLLKVELDNTNGRMRYYLDGTLIWIGTVWAGTAFEQAVLFSDNFQLPGEIGRIDDVSFEPGVAPPPAPPTADVNDDCVVNVTDLLAVIAAWGATGSNPADVNGDNVVNVTDLLAVIAQWSQTCQTVPNGACCNTGNCTSTSFLLCEAAGGTFQGGTVTCASVTCPQPANNDHPAGAIDITANINGAAVNGDNAAATPAPGGGQDPDLPAGSPTCNWLQPTSTCNRTLWYKFTAPAGGAVTLGLCASLSAGFSDGDLAVFSGTPGSFVEVACDDFSCAPANTFPYNATITATLTGGQVYHVVVSNAGGWTGSVSGPFILTITSP